MAHDNIGSNIQLSKAERRKLAHVLHNACMVADVNRRIEEYAPKMGVVRLLRLTEKQYNNIYMVSGGSDYQEKTVGVNAHIIL